MKRKILVRVWGVILTTMLIVEAAIPLGVKAADSGDVPASEALPNMVEMMERWKSAATPGEHHKKLDVLVGKWKMTIKTYMGGPGSEPSVTEGTSVIHWILDNRFVQEETFGEMMMPGPDGEMEKVDFQGLGIHGYDNYRNLFVSTWRDNMGTQQLVMSGTVDPTGKIFTYYGEMDEPMLGVTGRMVKYVTRLSGRRKRVFEIYDLHAGEDYKVVEIQYERY